MRGRENRSSASHTQSYPKTYTDTSTGLHEADTVPLTGAVLNIQLKYAHDRTASNLSNYIDISN